ncbi:hypothetical protein LQ564_04775 [Massilia sp. G4R7]|uniref:Uncharacterized protein n=1 Tax=Massilia phyllostachyos TaxID=2898585 RepID=A0ABS8Q1K7_9BURK|nr:hypothetical protein [Massilia phyllostachyos]MCD2515622.1 hypothetical protein [Massilia phyllostachyos]
MSNVVSAALEYASQHQDASDHAEWQVHFVGDESRTGHIEHVQDNIYALVKSKGDTYYFDADKVMFLRLK